MKMQKKNELEKTTLFLGSLPQVRNEEIETIESFIEFTASSALAISEYVNNVNDETRKILDEQYQLNHGITLHKKHLLTLEFFKHKDIKYFIDNLVLLNKISNRVSFNKIPSLDVSKEEVCYV